MFPRAACAEHGPRKSHCFGSTSDGESALLRGMRPISAFLAVVLLTALSLGRATANDGSADATPAGGIVPRKEGRVTMRKERLFIRRDKVRVEYEFVNDSKEDVWSGVAFPLPEYYFSPVYGWPDNFTDFKAWVGGSRIQFATEVKALKGGTDVTAEVESAGLDIRTLGRVSETIYQWEPDGTHAKEVGTLGQIPRLPMEKLERLRSLGLVGAISGDEARLWPSWGVRVTYFWIQHFPPGEVVRIRHEYTPALGNYPVLHTDIKDACIEASLRKTLEARRTPQEQVVFNTSSTEWVSYILTTANSWKTPILDFELEIEHAEGWLVSLCWDGKMERSGPRSFKSTMKDFVPRNELKVYFLKPAPRASPSK